MFYFHMDVCRIRRNDILANQLLNACAVNSDYPLLADSEYAFGVTTPLDKRLVNFRK